MADYLPQQRSYNNLVYLPQLLCQRAAAAKASDTYCSEQGPQLESETNLQRDKKKMKYSRRLHIYMESQL